jgi:anti-sigma-K factor RskA
MAPPRQSNDFERRYFNQIDDGFKDLKSDIEEVRNDLKSLTAHVQKTNGRLARVESRVFPPKPETMRELPSVWRDPKILTIITLALSFCIIVAFTTAALLGVPLPRGILP